MAEQLVLLELDREPTFTPPAARRRPAASSRRRAGPRQARDHAWRLDHRTVAVGRRGLEQARQALHRAPQTAA